MPLPENLPACLEPWRRHPTLRANTLAAVDMWRLQPWTMQAASSPSFTRLSQWLLDHVPDEEATPCLVHVDYGPHNVLVDGSEVSAVLDWEAARIGDPAEDLSYLLQCFGAGADRQATIDWYAEASGNVISEKRLRYFDAFNLQKMIAGPMGSAVMYEQTPNIAIEWCNLSLRWMAFGTAGVAQRIALAEAA
jgi:aminoglycoside phosphotransferase (APT) family kinase protein